MNNIINSEFDLSGTWYNHFVSPAGNEHIFHPALTQKSQMITGQMPFTKRHKTTNVTETKIFSVHG